MSDIISDLEALIAKMRLTVDPVPTVTHPVGPLYKPPSDLVQPSGVSYIEKPFAIAAPPSPLTLTLMQRMWPNGNQHVAGLLEGIAAAAPTVFPKYKLDSPLLIAHAMAQFSEECGAGLEMAENMNYTAERLMQVFPTHFSPSLAARAAHNPRMIADIAYGGRMGNAPPPSDDGYNYRGRGPSQVTGREGYGELQNELRRQGEDIDIIANPDLVCEPRTTLLCGVADFVLCGCLPYAQRDDVVGVTRRLNGGLNGLAVREQWLAKWKAALSVK